MKATTSQKVCFGLLGLGLLAFAADRTVFSPAAAQASDEPASLLVAQPARPEAVNAAPVAVLASATINPVSQKLKVIGEMISLSDSPARDAFALTPAWGVKTAGQLPGEQRFDQTHRLTGVMIGRQATAMIDGKPVTVGQAIDGYKLVSVTNGMATFKSRDGEVTLQVERPR